MNHPASPDPPAQPIDLNQLAQGYRLELKTESTAEQESRLRREEIELTHKLAEERARADHQRVQTRAEARQRRLVFWAVFGSLLVIALISIVILLQDDASTETQTFARTLISAILAGLVGYFGGAAGKAPLPPPT